jgi:hypothetical protein
MKKPTILSPIIEKYFSVDSLDSYELHFETRERISTIRNMQILIYSNDHNPPHFHVKSKDNRVNAKFVAISLIDK